MMMMTAPGAEDEDEEVKVGTYNLFGLVFASLTRTDVW